MRIVSYNILRGAKTQDRDRTAIVLKLLKGQNADVVGLCECTEFAANNHERLRYFESALNMQATINSAPSGEHVAIFSKKSVPILAAGMSAVMMYHGYSYVVVNLPTVGRVTILMTHLHPRSPTFRLAEAENVLAKATQEPNALVMGDFNTVLDHEAEKANQLSVNDRVRFFGSPSSARGDVPRLFGHYGFVDLGALSAQPTYPTKAFGMLGETQLRVDFMFGTSDIATRAKFSTIVTAESEEASDHLPLLCDLME